MTRHDPNRRAEIVRTIIDLVDTRGLEAVSVREVAQHAGVSIGAVQHHFPTKAAMLLAAIEQLGTIWRETLEKEVPRENASATLRWVARHLLPTEENLRAGRVWLAFVAQAAVDEEIAAVYRSDWQVLEQRLARLIAAAWSERAAENGRDASGEAGTLLALLDGLAVAVITEPQRMPIARACAILDCYLDHLLDS